MFTRISQPMLTGASSVPPFVIGGRCPPGLDEQVVQHSLLNRDWIKVVTGFVEFFVSFSAVEMERQVFNYQFA